MADSSEVLAGYDRPSAMERMERRKLDDMEGLWHYPEERVTFAIERMETGGDLPCYRIVVADADDQSVDCGSLAGYMQETAEPGKLRLWLYSERADNLLMKPVECVAEAVSDDMISIVRPKLKFGVSVNLMRFLPSLFGGVRIYPRVEKEGIDPGFRKIWPRKDKVQFVIF